jgi:hypothetical protein
VGGSSKRRVSSQYEPVLWPCGSRPLRLPPRSGTGWHARNGELILLAYRCFGWVCSVKHEGCARPEISRNRMVSCMASNAGCVGAISGDWLFSPAFTAPISEGVRCYFATAAPRIEGFRGSRQPGRCYFDGISAKTGSRLPSTLPNLRGDAHSPEVSK